MKITLLTALVALLPTTLGATPGTLKTSSGELREKCQALLLADGPLQLVAKDQMPSLYIKEIEAKERILDGLKATFDRALRQGDQKTKTMTQRLAALFLDDIQRSAAHALEALEISGRTLTEDVKKAHENFLGEVKAARAEADKLQFL